MPGLRLATIASTIRRDTTLLYCMLVAQRIALDACVTASTLRHQRRPGMVLSEPE